jgi:hypothetical protein
MRTLCLLLILANALFFIWSQLIDVQVSALDRAPAVSATPPPRLVLARELGAEGSPGAGAGKTIQEQPVSDGEPPLTAEPARPGPEEDQVGADRLARVDELTCTSVGPFADLQQASEAQAALLSAGYDSRQRMDDGEIWVGYWVSVQDLGRREDAAEVVKLLATHGLTDVYLMPGSEPSYVVSLGVFSDYQRAQRRAAEVRAIGLQPRVQDRKRTGSVYWIDVDLPEPGHALDLSLFQTGLGRITRLEMRACPSQGSGSS